MNMFHEAMVWGVGYVIVGLGILLHLDRLAQFDQNSGQKIKLWFNKKIGERSFLNRELWPVGTPRAFRGSKRTFLIVGAFCTVLGFAFLAFAVFGPSLLRIP